MPKLAPAAIAALPIVTLREVPAADRRSTTTRDVIASTKARGFVARWPHSYSVKPTKRTKTLVIGGTTYAVEWAK
jgi:hypothetical protein